MNKPTPTMSDMGPEHENWTNMETSIVANKLSSHDLTLDWLKDLANSSRSMALKADTVHDWLQRQCEKELEGVVLDLLIAALARVNYPEIIEHHQE